MATVKGSRQHPMVVVPHRPWYRVGMAGLCLAALLALGWLAYEYGMQQASGANASLLRERETLLDKLAQTDQALGDTRQALADLKLGGAVDELANEEVRQSVEDLQNQIAVLNEEIRFYKGVMVPNADEKGLRIERFGVTATDNADQFRYQLQLTQVVEKHEYVSGEVEISIVGKQPDEVGRDLLSEPTIKTSYQERFRFRYFQNIEGEIKLPQGFSPNAVVVRLKPSGQKRDIEKTFDWLLKGV